MGISSCALGGRGGNRTLIITVCTLRRRRLFRHAVWGGANFTHTSRSCASAFQVGESWVHSSSSLFGRHSSITSEGAPRSRATCWAVPLGLAVIGYFAAGWISEWCSG